jgi:hypothetical protein
MVSYGLAAAAVDVGGASPGPAIDRHNDRQSGVGISDGLTV